ncbi:hypothetical protein G6F22_020194 [Rhizopus arrhizus]|nr:hypothetical protein G6F22_020194 [Rhizopus arrhizus]
MRAMTSASATWMVTSSTRSSSLANIMAKSCVAERSARISRRRDDRPDTAGLRVVDGGAHVVIGAPSGGGADLPGRQVGGQRRATGDDVDAAGIQPGLAHVGHFNDVQARAQL